MNKLLWSVILIISASAGALAFNIITALPQPKFALYYQQSRTISDFELTDHLGKSFANKQLKGKWSFVFFGYISCPDVCPTSLQNLSFIYEDLKRVSDNSQVLLVSVDPKRDSQVKLAQYINYFNQEFIALRGEHDVLYPFTQNLGLMYAITNLKGGEGKNSSESYQVDHSASIALINPEGNLAAIFKAEQELGEVPSIDNKKLLSDYQKIIALY